MIGRDYRVGKGGGEEGGREGEKEVRRGSYGNIEEMISKMKRKREVGEKEEEGGEGEEGVENSSKKTHRSPGGIREWKEGGIWREEMRRMMREEVREGVKEGLKEQGRIMGEWMKEWRGREEKWQEERRN